jgi:hypothetical protein
MRKLKTYEVALEMPTNGGSAETVGRLRHRTNGKQEVAEVRLPSVLVGRIVMVRESGEALVDFSGNTSGNLVSARSLVPINVTTVGREVALTFEDGDASKPIIAGLLQAPASSPVPRELKLDDESLHLSAKKEVVIQCGKASITLTSAGKVLIRGAYLLSRSSGVNRIKGGSVQIN